MNFRSRWEANVYRFYTQCVPALKLIEYEPHLFTSDDGLPRGVTYLPDFKLTYHDNRTLWVEVKGVWDDRSLRHLSFMKKYCPSIHLVYISKKEYEAIKNGYSRQIKNWE